MSATISAYFSQIDEGFQFMKMIELQKRRPNAWSIMETAQKIAAQKLMFSQGATVQQVATNPSVAIEEPNAFAIPGVTAPASVHPPVNNDLAVLVQSVTKLTEKVDVLTSHSKKQNYRLNQLELERESESTPTPTS